MDEAGSASLQDELRRLGDLYARGEITLTLYRAALVGLGLDAEQIQRTIYHIHIDRGDGIAIGDQSRVTLAGPGPDVPAASACPPGTDDAEALACYLRHVVEANRRLQLQGIRSAGQLVSIDLEQIYITLTASERRTVTEEEAWLKEMVDLAPGERERRQRLGEMDGQASRVQVKVQVQEVLSHHKRLVVLGDPGSGKTTLLRWLALTYARGMLGHEGLVGERLRLDEDLLPVLLPLRMLSHHLEADERDPGLDGPRLLLDYLRTFYQQQDVELPARFFAERLQAGTCMVLLDGVDEVADLKTRQRVARLVEKFTVAYPQNRYVVTSRILGYTGAARLGADYATTTVCDFSEADIERFASYWNLAVELVLNQADTPYARRQAVLQTQALMQAVRDNERVRELAVNPLLLTVIALVQRYRAQLPERRAELYEEAVEVLLGAWDEAKGLETRAVLGGREMDARDRRTLLEPVALWMMEQHTREIEAAELQRQLRRRFDAMCPDAGLAEKAAEAFRRLINERSGLLAERGQDVYIFSHLTFQEYLAARAVVDRPDPIPYVLERLGDSWWREVILLAVGCLGRQRATALVGAIAGHRKEPELYHNLVLAAECLRDLGAAGVEGELWNEVQGRLRREVERPLRVSVISRWARQVFGGGIAASDAIRRRAAAAEALAKIESGAPGTQPAFWRLPYGEPVWVEVPGGAFCMGGEAGEDEKPAHQVHLETFYIARVPVTNAQYRIFVEAAGHRAPGHWTDGRVPRGLEGHPVAYVSWQDALAYCRWLDETLRGTSFRIQAWCGGRVEARDLRAEGWRVCLPSEAEWEKAARGDRDRRAYPWGDEWDEAKCNTRELGLGETTPAGVFPEGASPYGCLEMAGNVWEWTRSVYRGYPYDPLDGRESLEGGEDVARVLRGGSFSSVRERVRCSHRLRDRPFGDRYLDGFRCAVSPIS